MAKTDFTINDAQAVFRAIDFKKTFASEKELFLYPETYVELGKRFFFDVRFSEKQDTSCATCHQPEKFFTDGLAVAKTSGASHFNTPTLINVALYGWFFWDGRKDSLASQALGPIENKFEHNFDRVRVYRVLAQFYKPDYEKLFGRLPSLVQEANQAESTPPSNRVKNARVDSLLVAYSLKTLASLTAQKEILNASQQSEVSPVAHLSQQIDAIEEISKNEREARLQALSAEDELSLRLMFENFGRTLAAYEERLLALNTPFDKFVRSLSETPSDQLSLEPQAHLKSSFQEGFGPEQWNGFKIFAGKGRCISCHFGVSFSDSQFHNIGLTHSPEHIENWPWGRALGLARALEDESACLERNRAKIVDNGCVEMENLERKNLELLGAFKTASLRNLAYSAPYMHDGRFSTLASVLEFYATPLASKVPWFGHAEETLGEISLTPPEQKSLEVFLESLNDHEGVRRLTRP